VTCNSLYIPVESFLLFSFLLLSLDSCIQVYQFYQSYPKECYALVQLLELHESVTRLGQVVQPNTDIRNYPVIPEDTPSTKQVLKLYKNLYKAESALLVQACTKQIGLAQFLYNRKVPGITTAKYWYEAEYETPRHIALFCVQEANSRQFLLDPTGRTQPYSILVGTAEGAKKFIQ
jgi:hypothetical protein